MRRSDRGSSPSREPFSKILTSFSRTFDNLCLVPHLIRVLLDRSAHAIDSSLVACQTHRWRKPSLNTTDALVPPCLRKHIQHIVVNFRATTSGKFALQLQTRLCYLGRVRDGDLGQKSDLPYLFSTPTQWALTAQHAATPPIKKFSRVESGRGVGLVVAIGSSEFDRLQPAPSMSFSA